MATRITRDHHNLQRNLRLNGKYISNDGGDEGISVSDAGVVSVSAGFNVTGNLDVTGNLTKTGGITFDCSGDIIFDADGGDVSFYDDVASGVLFSSMDMVAKSQTWLYDAYGYCKLLVEADGATTLSTFDSGTDENGHLTLAPDGNCIIDRNVTNTSAGTYKGLSIDFDKTGSGVTSDNTLYGLEVTLTSVNVSESGQNTSYGVNATVLQRYSADAGVQNVYGGRFQATSDTDGTSTTYGLMAVATGADTNYGLYINCADGGNDLRIVSNADNADYSQIATTTSGATTLSTVDGGGAAAHLTLNVDGDIELNADGGQVEIKDDSASHFLFDCDNTRLRIYDDSSASDYLDITVAAVGATTIQSVHGSSLPDASYIRLIAGDYIWLNNCDVHIDDGKKLYLDGGGDTFLEHTSDSIYFNCGDDRVMSLVEQGATGNSMVLGSTAVGFTQVTASFDATDTDIDFRAGQKQLLTLTADITDVHFQFPDISGNFLCIFLQDGTGGWDVANWKTKDSAGNAGAGNSGVVKWAGGSATTLTETANKADIVTIYWDNTNEMAYAVASENF